MGNRGEGPQIPTGLSTEGERKRVTILFADISDFTAYSEKTDPEAVRDLINDCFSRLAPVVAEFQGTLEKYIGDEIMAIFGAPFAHENDAELGVLCGLALMEKLVEFNRERGTNLGMHIGINTGLVVAGGIGTREYQQYGVTGDAVNLAARLKDASERGQILVGPYTWRLTEPLFEFNIDKPLRLKGMTKPVPVYRVLGPKVKPGRSRGLEIYGIYSPLIGREPEITIANQAIRHLLAGQGAILNISGEAGVGKSRLLMEIREGVPGDRLNWLEGSTLSFGQAISYWPFQEILRRFAGINRDDGEGEAWDKLENKVKALIPEDTAAVLPYLASLLALPARTGYERQVKFLDSEALGKQIFLASRRFFGRLSRDRPVVLVFEDLQWMDESSTKLLEHLLPLTRQVPLLIIGTSRPNRESPSGILKEMATKDDRGPYTEIILQPLTQYDSLLLLHNLLEIENLSPHLRQMIVAKADGNPFFLEEVLRTLIDTQIVRQDPVSGQWRATAQIESVTIPDTIQGVIMARVDQLNDAAKYILRVASIIGRNFLYRILLSVAEEGNALDEHIAELLVLDLIREHKRMPELEYIFKHALTQEATYESILLKQRRVLHARVGQAIEVLFALRLDEFYGVLAYHYAQAETWEKAQEYLLKAGDQAERIAADAEALIHYQQAMAAYERSFGGRWDPLQRVMLLRKMGQAFVRRGEHSKAGEYLREALALLGYHLPTSGWGIRGTIFREAVQQASRRLLSRQSLGKASSAPDLSVEEEARLYIELLEIAVVDNPEVLLMLALRLTNFSERNGFLPGVVMGASALGAVADFIPIAGLAGRYHKLAVALADQIQQPAAVGLSYQILTLHEFYLGEWSAALVHGRRSTQAHRQAGGMRGWGWATYLMACILIYQADYPRAQEFGQDLIQYGQDGADLLVQCLGHDVLGFVHQLIGPLEEAITHQKKAIELAEAVPDILTRIGAGAKLGQSYLRQGKVMPALDVLEECRRLSLKHKEPHHFATLCNITAEAYLFAAEQISPGAPERAAWMEKADRGCKAALGAAKAFRGRKPEALRLRGRYEWLRGKPAAARKWWLRSLAETDTLGMPYESGMAHLEIGRRLAEPFHRDRAESIFAEIGIPGHPA